MRRIGFDRVKVTPSRTAKLRERQAVSEFEELAMPLVSSVYNLARWLVRNEIEAEDLVQETFLKALRNFGSFQSGTDFRAWMFRILRNTFLSSRSTLERRMTVELKNEEELPLSRAQCISPESLFIERSNIAAIRSAIERLPLRSREVILLCDVEDLAYKEIAEILEIPIGTVMSRLARARKAIREALQPAEMDHYRQSAPLN
ncbi:sigma-70 family RNA polymerase sigma factor [Acidicapsa acidisoli]|uniref:sigma-70 family RNA polymerase sigma factor n=1 Tax=Acidicapsa acidisoli TaxID=1615681 RepID=UPI0021DF8BEF|nr:sigma-70 family RNA polymerase sigma factor [Acidicapsa acidisoli]